MRQFTSASSAATKQAGNAESLKSATGYIRTEVGKRWYPLFADHCCLKKIHPSITMKIDKILRDIEKKD